MDPAWLGTGVYFWQDALNWATEWADSRRRFLGLEGSIAVVAAEISLAHCLDLCDSYWSKRMEGATQRFLDRLAESGRTLTNEPDGGHFLDCAFFNYAVTHLALEGLDLKVVRAPCLSGRQLFANSPIYTLGHIQIAAVRDLTQLGKPRLIPEGKPRSWRRGANE